jgi:hypothetical protein
LGPKTHNLVDCGELHLVLLLDIISNLGCLFVQFRGHYFYCYRTCERVFSIYHQAP